MGAGTILDQRKHHPAHIREDDTALAEGGRPLHLDRIDEIEPFAGVGGIPGDERHSRSAFALIDAESLAALQRGRPVPAAGDGFLMDDRGSIDGGGGKGARRRQGLRGKFQPLLLMFLVALPVGSDLLGRTSDMIIAP